MKKLFTCMCLTLCICAGSVVPAFAAVSTGEINQNERNCINMQHESKNSIETREIPQTWYEGSKRYLGLDEQVFVKYLTGSWTYADGYTWDKSNSTQWGFAGGVDAAFSKGVKATLHLNWSHTTTYDVAVHIDADNTRLSKLGFYSDYKHYNATIKRYYDLGLMWEKTKEVWEPTEDTYVLATYK